MDATPEPIITHCPPGAARGAVLDEFVHMKQKRPVSATFRGRDEWESPGLCFSDYERCSKIRYKLNSGRKHSPPWVHDDKKLRAVLVRYVEVRACFQRQQSGTESERLQRAQTVLKANQPRHETLLT